MNKEMKFKTNLDCGHCVARVKPFLDELEGISNWNVDTSNPDKILTVESSSVSAEQIIDAVENVGFDIQQI